MILENITNINFSSDEKNLNDVDLFIVAIPTPIDKNNKPDLSILKMPVLQFEIHRFRNLI